MVGRKGSDSTGREVQVAAGSKVNSIGGGRVAIVGGLTSDAVMALSLLMLLALVETSEDTLGVVISLLHGPDDGGVQTFNDLVHKKVKLLIVNAVFSQVSDGLVCLATLSLDRASISGNLVEEESVSGDVVDYANISADVVKKASIDNDGLEGITDNVVVGDKHVHNLAGLTVLEKHGIHDLADLALFSNDLIDGVTSVGEDTLVT